MNEGVRTMIDPIAVDIGVIQIRWYGVLIAAAVLIGTILAMREVRRKGINEDHFFNILLVAIPSAFVGARLYYVLFNLDFFMQNPLEIPAVWHGGLAIHGGLLGAFIAAFLMIRHYKMSFWQVTDCAAPAIALGQSIGRWGNYFNQEAYGFAVDPEKAPWAMWIDGAYRHPTFLYESIWDFSIFLFLLWLRRKSFIQEGEVVLSYLVLYSVGRFVIEGFRTDSLMLGSLRMAQLVSLALIGIGILLIWYRRRKRALN